MALFGGGRRSGRMSFESAPELHILDRSPMGPEVFSDPFATLAHNMPAEERAREEANERRSHRRFMVTANLAKAFMGASAFELPWALGQSGLGMGVFLLALYALVSLHTIKLLCRCRSLSVLRNPTFIDLGYEAFGSIGSLVATFLVGLMTFGVCASYINFIGSTVATIIPSIDKRVCMLSSLPLLFTLTLFPSFRYISVASSVGTLLVVASMVAALLFGPTGGYTWPHVDLSSFTSPFVNWKSLPLFVGNAAFLFCIHTVALPIRQSLDVQPPGQEQHAGGMEESLIASGDGESHFDAVSSDEVSEARDSNDFFVAANKTVLVVFLVNAAFAVACDLLFGDSTCENIILNLPNKSGAVLAIKLLLVITMILTYSLFLMPLAQLLGDTDGSDTRFGCLRFVVARAALVGGTGLLAVAVPHFALVTNLVGGVANTLVGLVLPPIFYVRLSYLRQHEGRLGSPSREVNTSTESPKPRVPVIGQHAASTEISRLFLPAFELLVNGVVVAIGVATMMLSVYGTAQEVVTKSHRFSTATECPALLNFTSNY